MTGCEASIALVHSSAYYNENTSEGIFALVASKREFESIEQARKYASASAFKRASMARNAQALERKRWTIASASTDTFTVDVVNTLVDNDIRARVKQAVRALPTMERALVIDKYYRNKSVSSIAREYGTTRASVRYLLARAQARLRDSLQDLQ